MSTALPVREVLPGLFVAHQLDADAMAAAAQAGFRSVINNRPDFEHDLQQPTNASIEAAAHQVGLEYRFLPVAGGWQSPEEIEAFAALMQSLPKPILAFCRSGARSTRLAMAAAEQQG